MDLQGFQQYQAAYYSGFSDTGIAIEDMVSEGDRVAFRGVVRATHKAEFMGIPASGKQVVVPVIGIALLAEGKIAEWWNSPDRLSWMQQIGALPAGDQGRHGSGS
jgi:predicted ester cyclase